MSDIFKIQFTTDSEEYLLPDVSYNVFVDYIFKEGCSDIEYDKYLSKNNMVELTDFNYQTTPEIILIVENKYRERILKFKCIYDSEEENIECQ